MIGLVLAAAVQFSYVDLGRAIDDDAFVEVVKIGEKYYYSPDHTSTRKDACILERDTVTSASMMRQSLVSGVLVLSKPDLVSQNGGPIYHLSDEDRKVVEVTAIHYETLAKNYAIDCGRGGR